jgi:hypothetical protein
MALLPFILRLGLGMLLIIAAVVLSAGLVVFAWELHAKHLFRKPSGFSEQDLKQLQKALRKQQKEREYDVTLN